MKQMGIYRVLLQFIQKVISGKMQLNYLYRHLNLRYLICYKWCNNKLNGLISVFTEKMQIYRFLTHQNILQEKKEKIE